MGRGSYILFIPLILSINLDYVILTFEYIFPNCDVTHTPESFVNYAVQHNVVVHNVNFVGRDEELAFLEDAYNKDKSQMIVIFTAEDAENAEE